MRNKIITTFFLSFIVGIGILHVLTPDRSFSEHENRVLASFPTFNSKQLFSGTFTDKFETYVTDQFFAKNMWLGMKAKAEQAWGKQENNGIYFGDDDFLLEPFTRTDEQMTKNIGYINDFVEQLTDTNTFMMLVPTAIEIYPEYAPAYAPTDSQKGVLHLAEQSLNHSTSFINIYDELVMHKQEPIYFRTDHHWTMRGAYYGYVKAAKQMGLDPLPKDAFEKQIVSDDFYGTHHSKANDFMVKSDNIEYYQPKTDRQIEVTYDQEDITHNLVTWDALNTKDQYRFFLDGNHRIVTIEANAKNDDKLVVIKDSYAHAFVPFLTAHFSEIHVLDLRYFNESVTDYIDLHNITDVLFLYNIPTFSSDKNLIWLKR